MHAVRIVANLRVPDVDAAKSFDTDYLGLSTAEFNMKWVARFTSPATGANVLLVTRPHDQVPDAPRGRIPKDATPKQRMARKLRTKKGKAAYARRKVIVEPVFGQMKTTQGAGRLPAAWS